jgi:hypothetical protein
MNVKIPSTVTDKRGCRELAERCRSTPTQKTLNDLQVLLGVKPSFASRPRRIRERLEALLAELAEYDPAIIGAGLIEPENRTPMKLDKQIRKLQQANSYRPGNKS